MNLQKTLAEGENYLIEAGTPQYIAYQLYNKKGYNAYKVSSTSNDFSIIKSIECPNQSDTDVNHITTYNSDVALALDNTKKPSDIIKVGVIDENGNTVPNCANFRVGLPISNSLNYNLYKYYLEKGIDIYNPQDKAFKDACYISKNFDYDLTQKYRRKNLYQGYRLDFGEGCEYDSFDLTTNRIIANCESVPSEVEYNLVQSSLSDYGIKVNHVDNLPTKCGGDVENIEENIAFWLFLIFFVVIIVFDIILAVGGIKTLLGKNGIDVAIANDGLNREFNSVLKTEHQKTENENGPIKTEEIQVSIPSDKSFCSILCNNFKALHPLFSLCHQSILSPIIFTSWVFLYNLLNLFGFNALYFNETMLEDRIYDKHRDNFGYPMKTEFEKIMAAISTCIALTIVVRLITLVTLSMKEKLIQQLQTNKATEQVIGEFTKSMLVRRIIAGVFMLALNVFFFYYCVVFCGIYVNAQYGWFYSGIWSLIFNWVAYAPLYILIISAIESSGNETCAYYMKRLFVF